MPARRRQSSRMWEGPVLSALAHAGLVALALVALPWLRAPRERAAPILSVSLVAPATLDAAIAALSRPPPAQEGPPRVQPPSPTPAADTPVTDPPDEPTDAVLPTLAPAFDPDSPLGLGPVLATPDLPAHRPHARPGTAESPPPADPAVAAADFAAAVRGAVLGQVGNRAPGPTGTVRLALIINREGRLLAARLMKPSGVPSLDRAAADAARTARLPAMPEAMPQARITVEIDVVFAAIENENGG